MHNFPLVKNFALDTHGVAVTKEVMDFLSERYKVDVVIPRDKNTLVELQSQFG